MSRRSRWKRPIAAWTASAPRRPRYQTSRSSSLVALVLPCKRRSVEGHSGNLTHQLLAELIAEMADPLGLFGHRVEGHFQRLGKAGNTGDVEGPTPQAEFVAAAVYFRRQSHSFATLADIDALTPLGPYSLCALKLIRSTPSVSTLTGIFPTACVASVWSKTSRSRQSAAISGNGWITPIS